MGALTTLYDRRVSRLELDAVIDRLDDVLRAAGLAGLEAPKDLQVLDDVAEALAPFALPLELRRFWERLDPERLPITLFPRLYGPATALELHRVDLEFSVPLRPPALFFVVGYDSHVHRSIELVSEWDSGGTILRWAWDEDAFRIAYRSVADFLEVVSELVSAGCLERYDDELYVTEQAEEKKASERVQASPPHPLYGVTREISRDLRSWPAHWLAASGIDLRDREPLGATHTIAELVAAAEAGPVRGRIAGLVTRLAGIGHDTIVLVDDGTRALDVWCPAEASTWGPAQSQRFEFEVVIEGPVEAPLDFDAGHAELQSHALAGRVAEAQTAADAFLGRIGRHRAPAVATDIRPLDEPGSPA